MMDYIARHLLIGNLAEACDEELLRKYRIGAVVNCCKEAPPRELYQKLGLQAIWIPFDDGVPFGPELHAVFIRAFEFVSEELGAGKNVLVHCRAGVSRSSAFMASYLFWSGAEPTFDKAFRRVRTAHPITLPHFDILASFQELLGLAADREVYIEFWQKEMVKRGY
ncbi:MAG: dual specificity protein phosphatase [Candidatus Sungiibacteriota bacterium]